MNTPKVKMDPKVAEKLQPFLDEALEDVVQLLTLAQEEAFHRALQVALRAVGSVEVPEELEGSELDAWKSARAAHEAAIQSCLDNGFPRN